MQFWRYSAATDVGLQRNNNEDCYLSSPELGLWVVADGMGGHAAGEVASAIVAETIKKKVDEGENLSTAIQLSHREVLHAAANGHGGQGMGSTVVALLTDGSSYEIAWVGDSRAYLWSPGSLKPFRQLTTDHSYVQMLYQTGAITEAELSTHPEKNIITQCLGSVELESVTVETVEGTWKPNEWIILCSDGLTDAVNDVEIENILSSHTCVDKGTNALIEAALNRGGKDNITVSVTESPNAYLVFLGSFFKNLSKFFK
ncbi:MAG: protein phosphatase 2C domain-containing protein [Agarilytica sp.]